jgi:hypothetical protein
MLIIALVLAVIGLAALVFAVVTSNEVVAWVCIGASVLGVVLLIIDALQERQRREAAGPEPPAEAATQGYEEAGSPGDGGTDEDVFADYPEDASGEGEDEELRSHPADSGTDEGAETR